MRVGVGAVKAWTRKNPGAGGSMAMPVNHRPALKRLWGTLEHFWGMLWVSHALQGACQIPACTAFRGLRW